MRKTSSLVALQRTFRTGVASCIPPRTGKDAGGDQASWVAHKHQPARAWNAQRLLLWTTTSTGDGLKERRPLLLTNST